MEITILGTSSMVPTKNRNHTSIYIDLGNYSYLFDCGEGTQRQITLANLKATKINSIFISHWHGDHVLGIPGLIQTLASKDFGKTIHIYGPISTKERMKNMFNTFIFDNDISLEIHEINREGIIHETDEFIVEAYKLNHTIETFGFILKEKNKRKMFKKKLDKFSVTGENIGKLQDGKSIKIKNKLIIPNDVSEEIIGKKLGIIFDTTLAKNLIKIANNSDLLISESTYLNDLEEKAEDYKHLTVVQAAQIASQANAKKLILIHFSARYKETDKITIEARDIFKESYVAHDFMKIKL